MSTYCLPVVFFTFNEFFPYVTRIIFFTLSVKTFIDYIWIIYSLFVFRRGLGYQTSHILVCFLSTGFKKRWWWWWRWRRRKRGEEGGQGRGGGEAVQSTSYHSFSQLRTHSNMVSVVMPLQDFLQREVSTLGLWASEVFTTLRGCVTELEDALSPYPTIWLFWFWISFLSSLNLRILIH